MDAPLPHCIKHDLPNEANLLASDFDYHLPPNLIATRPAEPRDSARLMVLGCDGSTHHRTFRDMAEYLRPGDLLVLNDSRVIPARLDGRRPGGGFAEVTLLREVSGEPPVWEALVRPGRKLRPGDEVEFLPGELAGRILDVLPDGERVIRFDCRPGSFRGLLERHARMPLPPYIEKARGMEHSPAVDWTALDRERYQTVFARADGSVAAPTAGLHFTPELLDRVRAAGVGVAHVTLHVGLGTFKPIATERVEDHSMHEESWEVGAECAAAIAEARARGGRIIAVGTTSVRTLESACTESGSVPEGRGATRIMIAPGHRFRAVDALVTNFHLPRSTLLLLVSAMCSRERILAAYAEAIAHGYRFYSYGDAMLIERRGT